jgi:TusA-related sulfurtransferase
MGSIIHQVIEIDIRGQICPSTLLTALKAINSHKQELQSGAVKLTFKTSNRDAIITIPDAAINMGYGINVTKEADYYLIIVDDGK